MMKEAELKMIEGLSNELKVLAENGYTFLELADYVDDIIYKTSEDHSNAYFNFLYELRDIYEMYAENE